MIRNLIIYYDFLKDTITEHHNKNILIVAHGGVSIPVTCFFNDFIPQGSLVNAGLVLGNCQVAKYLSENNNHNLKNRIVFIIKIC